jgi:hypothetical protein
MPKFNNPGGGTRQPVKKTQAGGIPLIIEPKCKVCQSPHRHLVDQMLVAGHTYSEIERQFAFANLPRRSVSSHANKHLGYEEAAIRTVIEREALAAQRNYEQGVDRLVTKNAYLEVALQKAYDALIKNDTIVEPKDAVKVIETLQKLQEQNQAVALDELRVQLQTFIQAVKEVVPKGDWESIVGRTADLLRASGREVPFAEEAPNEEEEFKELTPAEVVSGVVANV